MMQISREFWFSAAHRIEGHPKCGRLHGHNYKVVVLLRGTMDKSGMIIDFGVVDRIVKPIIDEMDHRYLASQDNVDKNDPYLAASIMERPDDVYRLTVPHSTAEEIAMELHRKICMALKFTSHNVSVLVQETPKSEALYEG